MFVSNIVWNTRHVQSNAVDITHISGQFNNITTIIVQYNNNIIEKEHVFGGYIGDNSNK